LGAVMIKRWTVDEVNYLREHYADKTALSVGMAIGKTESQVHNKAFHLKLKKSPEFLAKAGRELASKEGASVGRFKSGHQTWNKGIKVSTGLHDASRASQFKIGQLPHNHHPIGYERVDCEGYLHRKISDTGHTKRDFKLVHHIIWQSVHGEIPSGCYIVFSDGNKANFDIDNLVCLTKAENMKRNTIHRFSPELKEAIRLTKKLQKLIKREEQNVVQN
jgi:hypothetical protein